MDINSNMTRRQALRAAGALGAVGAASVALPSWLGDLLGPAASQAATACAKLTPELTEGPYWVNTMLHRSDVRANTHNAKTSPGVVQKGVPLTLMINALDASNNCKPLNGVAVDIWHANAHGLYSDESSQQAGGGTSGGNTSGQNFLRGYQITGKDSGVKQSAVAGQASFKTIWPGWYTSRAIHIHVRVRKLSSSGATIAGYTTQIFFSDADNAKVLTGAAPYDTRSPQQDPTTDENDTVLRSADDATNIVAVSGNVVDGFAATFNIMLDEQQTTTSGSLSRPSAGAPSGGGGRGPRGGG
jgi:protocatechuate 3,4-dioxygenase beta subunit